MAKPPASRNSAKIRVPAPALGDEDRKVLTPGAAIIGIDEVGRGALAGPLVVAGIRLLHIPENPEIRDSKKLSPSRRERVCPWIHQQARDLRFVEIWPDVIDLINILEATKFAMRQLINELKCTGDTVIVDAVSLGPGYEDVLSPIKADSHFFCVAAASIAAKVHRDRIMKSLASRYTYWGWEKNMGYGTLDHRKKLRSHGRSPLHRKSFHFSAVLP